MKFLNRSIGPIDGTLKGTVPSDKSRLRNTGNESVLHILQISRTESSPLDPLQSRVQDCGLIFMFIREKYETPSPYRCELNNTSTFLPQCWLWH